MRLSKREENLFCSCMLLLRGILLFNSQLMYYCIQTNAGAVMITDLVFWFILYPFLAYNQYDMNFVSIQTF